MKSQTDSHTRPHGNNRLADRWLDIHAIISLLLIVGFPINAFAVPLQITGQYTGQINGEPVSATASGWMDTAGTALNHFELQFQAMPSTINPFIAGNSWKSSYHPSAVFPSGGAVNLFNLSGGNYIAGRTVRWESLPGEELVLTANVTTMGGIMTANTTVSGTYTGPTDLIGVTNYQMLWTQINPTTIEVISTSTILRANGDSLNAQITSVYSGLTGQMPTHQQTGSYTFVNQQFSNNTMSFDWFGAVAPVPEPTPISLLSLGFLLTLAGTRIANRGGAML